MRNETMNTKQAMKWLAIACTALIAFTPGVVADTTTEEAWDAETWTPSGSNLLAFASNDVPVPTPPIEVGNVQPSSLLTFVDGEPVFLTRAAITEWELTDPGMGAKSLAGKLFDPRSEVTNLILQEDLSAPRSTQQEIEDHATFDLTVFDWPDASEGDSLTLEVVDTIPVMFGEPNEELLRDASGTPVKRFLTREALFETTVLFEDVPAFLGAAYILHVAGDSHFINPIFDPLDPETYPGADLMGFDPLGPQPLSSSCQYYSTVMQPGWDNYNRGWVDTTSDEWQGIAWGAWKYHWTYDNPCGTNTIHVKPVFGFGFSAETKMSNGGYHNVAYGLHMKGSKDAECNNYGPPKGYRCHGHIFELKEPKMFYRNPDAPGARHVTAIGLGVPSESCSHLLGTPSKLALSIVAIRYWWVGVASSTIPDSYCKENWKEITRDPANKPGLGVKMSGHSSTGALKQASGLIVTRYPIATHSFPMELIGSVTYDVWMKTCDHCNYYERDGQHYYETFPMAEVV